MKRGLILVISLILVLLLAGISAQNPFNEWFNLEETLYEKCVENYGVEDCLEECEIECGKCECESELASSSLLRELKNLFMGVIDYLREMLGFESEKPIELEILQDSNPNDEILNFDDAFGINEELNEEACQLVRKCIEKCPDKTQTYYEGCGDILEEFLLDCPVYDEDGIKDILNSFVGLGGENEEEIRSLLEEGKYSKALDKVIEVLKNLNPSSEEYQYFNNMKYKIYLVKYLEDDSASSKYFSESIHDIEDVFYESKQESEFLEFLREFEKERLALKALANEKSGNYDKAYQLYEELEELAWKDEPDLELMVNALIGQSRIMMKKGDYAGALDKLEKAHSYLEDPAIRDYQDYTKIDILYTIYGYNGKSIKKLLEEKREKIWGGEGFFGPIEWAERKSTNWWSLKRVWFSAEEIEKRTQQKFDKKGRILQGIKIMIDVLEKGYDLDEFVQDILNKEDDSYANDVIYDIVLPDVWNKEDIKDRHYQPFKDFVLEAIASRPGDVALMITNGNRDAAIRLIKRINPDIELNIRDYPSFVVGEEGKYIMGIVSKQGYEDPILTTNEEVADFAASFIDPLVIAGAGPKVVKFGKGALSLARMKTAWKLGPGLRTLRRLEKGRFTADEISRINKGMKVLREAGYTEKAGLLSKSLEFKKALLRAHYTANDIDTGQICAKSRPLRKFLTAAEQRPLFKNWVVGRLDKLIRKIKAETNGHRLADLAEKIPGVKKVEGPKHYNILKNGVKITEIPRHSTLKKGTLISIRKILIAELGG